VLLSLGEKDFHLFEVFSLEVDSPDIGKILEGYGLVAERISIGSTFCYHFSKTKPLSHLLKWQLIA